MGKRLISNAIIREAFNVFHFIWNFLSWKLKNRHNRTYIRTLFPISLVKVGRHSYGPLEVLSWGADNEGLEIGSFCSIAPFTKFILGGNHAYRGFLTFPCGVKFGGLERQATSKGPIFVGDDVWIGVGATIMSGVRIGKGAIVAACAVVTKDVEPYAIVGGNPAHLIKYRFSKSVREGLAKMDYTMIDENSIRKRLDLLDVQLDDSNWMETVSVLFRQ